MRSVWLLILAMSYSATSQCLRISSQAFCGMMPSRAWARARPASKSRYFWIRLSSENTRRIASVEKMSRKTAESMAVVGIQRPFGAGSGEPRASGGGDVSPGGGAGVAGVGGWLLYTDAIAVYNLHAGGRSRNHPRGRH